MKRMLRSFSLALALIVCLSVALTGCSSKPAEATESTTQAVAAETTTAAGAPELKPATLTVFSTISDQNIQDTIKGMGDTFTSKNPAVKIEFNFPGSEYENIMKIKMAANDLPDVFDTHGWAKIRYGEYLADLRDMKFVPELSDTIKDVITDQDGKVYCLVLSEAKDGIIYNEDLLKQYNIEIPKTIDELVAAAEKIKKDSNGEVTPFYFSGINAWTLGRFFNGFANALLISPEKNSSTQLLDGSFDWQQWTPLPAKLKEIKDLGLTNKDALTAKYSDLAAKFAENKVAFAIVGLSNAGEVTKINPEVKMGLMPIPAWTSDDEPAFSGGERWTMGIWKDSKNMEAAKAYVEFMGQMENMSALANVTKLPAGIKGINAEHEFAEYYDKYVDTKVLPFFDRVYLPNGMWDVMCKTGTQILADQVTPEQFSETMKQEVERLSKK